MTGSVANMDEHDVGAQPRCEVCGTVMYVIDGGYQCRGCGHRVDIPWVNRSEDGDELPGVHG